MKTVERYKLGLILILDKTCVVLKVVKLVQFFFFLFFGECMSVVPVLSGVSVDRNNDLHKMICET